MLALALPVAVLSDEDEIESDINSTFLLFKWPLCSQVEITVDVQASLHNGV